MRAVSWAQKYARANREVMMARVLDVLRKVWPDLLETETAVNCHHNYVASEWHFGKDVLVTRKGAVRAGEGELGIILGSMGARSFIVRGKGNRDSFCTCSHGAGRAMSRAEAKRRFTVEDHVRATEGVECRKDAEVIDETPMAYKDIDAVMAAQADLVEIVHTLRQVVCVKG
jgi:tRNA-splicing ligase RtcB